MTVRSDPRLVEMPMMPVSCGRCGAVVLARKSSWQQTSVQWNAAATGLCRQRRDATALAGHSDRGLFLGCDSMRDSVSAAARDGALPVADGRR
ncbi:ferredoxin [Mycolicibacterium sp. (ex Dasyatis americana)]|uniref:Ferredoxin n=1 Tax=Mycobacterium syngnathidarum TaxID=1908205 RepID=A0A1Q9W388_9MYCO|nr:MULTISPECIES: ferredoxin [Mycobacterium]MCG7606445.1 ferredoxin [Mycobacterium sp. CnD-18-1]OFB38416.1 ferredoxin [Mycolicibacterium sp. (ex Dasyatis americana)]OHU05652.1 ferredoxin [Mycobacterium syngnathidarum]OLT87862.1 ferredoxin [Mycobacterium syngnathidarum]